MERRKLYAEVVQPLVDKSMQHEASLLAAATEGFRALLRDSGVSVRSRWRDIKDKVLPRRPAALGLPSAAATQCCSLQGMWLAGRVEGRASAP